MNQETFETRVVIRMYFLSGSYIEIKAPTFESAKCKAQKVFDAFPKHSWYSKRPE